MHGPEVDAEVALLREHLVAQVAGGVAQVHLLVVVVGGARREVAVAHLALVADRFTCNTQEVNAGEWMAAAD